MALPLLPIILAVASVGAGIVQGISNIKNSNSEADAVVNNAQQQINERARQAKRLMSQQKTSYLKGGVYFDSGSANEVINETYDTMFKDITDMANDANTSANNLRRQGKTAFFTSILKGVENGAMSFLGTGGSASSLSSVGKNVANSSVGTSVQN